MKLNELKLITKSANDADFSTFTAVIMEPNAVDAHGDIASEETIKKAAHDYVKNQKMVCGINHETVSSDIALVESYILKNDTEFNGQIINKGAWLGEFEVNSPEKKEQILNGDFTGVSIGAKAVISEITKSLRAKRSLDVVYVDEISLVDAPANNRTILQVNKSVEDKQGQQGGKMNFEDILKSLDGDSELLEKVEKALKDKKKGVAKKDDDEDEEEDIKKSLTPKLLKRFQDSQDRLIELEKKQEVTEKKLFVDKVVCLKKSSIKVSQTLSESLYKISKSFPTEYKDIECCLFDAMDTIKKFHYTVPVGEDVHEESNMTEGDKIVSVAKRMVKENPTLTLTKAYETVIKNKLHKEN